MNSTPGQVHAFVDDWRTNHSRSTIYVIESRIFASDSLFPGGRNAQAQYDQLNVIFGYNLQVEPVQGTDEIKCTFGELTDPDELPENEWPRNNDTPVVALQGDLGPVVIKSGSALVIKTLPLGKDRIPVTHYLRLTRIDLSSEPTQQ